MNLGETIYRLRTEKNMSQGDLADALNVSRQSVSKWENGNAVPDLEKLIKMSELFGVTLDELVGVSAVKKGCSSLPSESAPVVHTVIVHEKPSVTIQRVFGILLLFAGLLALITALNATTYKALYSSLLFFAMLSGCGTLILIFRRPWVLCGWLLCAGVFTFVFGLVSRWEKYPGLQILAWGCLIIMVLWTILSHRKGSIHVPKWIWIAGCIMIVAALVLYLVNILPPAAGDVNYSTHIPVPESGN